MSPKPKPEPRLSEGVNKDNDNEWQHLRSLRLEHDLINGKKIGTLTSGEKARLAQLRGLLDGTEFDPWSPTQTQRAYESIYGKDDET